MHYLEWNAKREEDFSFTFESVIRGHHVYNSVWTSSFGEILSLSPEDGNENDAYAVAVMKDPIVVGHAPRELPRVFSFFIRHDGSICAEVTGHRKYGCGLEILCKYTLQGKPKYIKRAKKLLQDKQKQSSSNNKYTD